MAPLPGLWTPTGPTTGTCRPTAGPWDEDAREDLREHVEDDELVARENRGPFDDSEEALAVAGFHGFRTRGDAVLRALAVRAVVLP